jgi:hypothetical protein
MSKTVTHTWTIYQSYFLDWRWEERTREGRILRESAAFQTRRECLLDLIHQSENSAPEVAESKRKS